MNISKVWAELVALGKRTLSLAVANTWTAKQSFTDYTDLGGVSVKLLRLSGTTDAAPAGVASVAHGLTASKILSVAVLVEVTAVYYPPMLATLPTHEFYYTVDAMNINVVNGAAAVDILNMPFTILIIHEE